MYERYWKLKQRPFEAFAANQFFCSLASQQSVADKLRYALIDQPGCCLLTGLPGSGKTAVAIHLIADHQEQFEHIVWLHQPYFDVLDLLRQMHQCIMSGLDEHERDLLSAGQLRDQIRQTFSQASLPILIILDEAHTIQDPQILSFLKFIYEWGLLAGAQSSQIRSSSVSLLLIGHPTAHHTLRQAIGFSELLSLQQLLTTLTRDELQSYLSHRMLTAGNPKECFTPAAVDALFHYSEGNLRKANQLADLSLLVGYVQQVEQLTEQEVLQAARELMLQQVA